MNEENKTYCGYVALVGRPNVGKSTLLNAILQKKLSITSNRPQTTRNRLLGIKTEDNYQTIYVDTPGICQAKSSHGKRKLNRYLEKTTACAMYDVDCIVFVVEALRWGNDDEWILDKLKASSKPIILVVNKVDQVKDKGELLPFIEKLNAKHDFVTVVPLSARKTSTVSGLEAEIAKLLPQNPFFFAESDVTDRSERFYATEVIREKLMRALGDEVPHSIAVQLEKFAVEDEVLHVSALILVERPGQKAIVIGKNGERLKSVGSKARQDLESFFEKKVFLKMWVKVKAGWPDDEQFLVDLGVKE